MLLAARARLLGVGQVDLDPLPRAGRPAAGGGRGPVASGWRIRAAGPVTAGRRRPGWWVGIGDVVEQGRPVDPLGLAGRTSSGRAGRCGPAASRRWPAVRPPWRAVPGSPAAGARPRPGGRRGRRPGSGAGVIPVVRATRRRRFRDRVGISERSPGGRAFVPRPPLRRPEFDPAEDHGQFGRGDAHLGGVGRSGTANVPFSSRRRYRANPSPCQARIFSRSPRLVPEHEQVAAQSGSRARCDGHHRLRARRSSCGRPAARVQIQMRPVSPRVSTARPPARRPAGRRPPGRPRPGRGRPTRPGRTISTVGSGITRTAANDGLGSWSGRRVGDRSRSASSRRLAKKVASLSPRAAQNARTDWPDSFQAAIVSRQNCSRSEAATGLRHGLGLLVGEKAPILHEWH